MKKPEITNKNLFLKYAIPCSSTLVMRGSVSQEVIDELKRKVIANEEITENLHDIFKVASVMCSATALDMGKTEIDAEVIREYFINRHDKAVKERWDLMKDFDKDKCKVRVVTYESGTDLKEEFCSGVEPGDQVAVHYDYVIEKLPKDLLTKKDTK